MLVHNEYSFSALRTSEENRAGPFKKLFVINIDEHRVTWIFFFKGLNVFNIYYMDYHGFNFAVLS